MITSPLSPVLMKKSVKTLVLITSFLSLSVSASAQLKLPVVSALATDMKKVIGDFPNRFINLMGEILAQHPQSTDYECNFKVSGAEACFITRYSAKKEICSFEALMLTTDNFDKAKQKFRSLFNQLNNLSADIGSDRHVRFKGTYESPDEKLKFTSVVFHPEPATETSTRLKVELALQFYEPMEWRVKVLVYDREREDVDRGREKEE